MSFKRRSIGVVLVEFPYQYTDSSGSIISIKPNEQYLLLEKTSARLWLVCKDESSEFFYVPDKYVRELPSRFPLDPADPPRPETTRVPETRRQHKTPQVGFSVVNRVVLNVEQHGGMVKYQNNHSQRFRSIISLY